jgi:hypothetical protein
MAKVNIEITLQGGEVGDHPRRYEPGSTVQGSVRVTPDGTVDSNRVVVRLEWHTEGRGDRNQGCSSEVEISTSPLSEVLVQPFTLTVPHDPWSYAGHHITIIWAVVVVVDVRHARDIRYEEPILVAPRGQSPSTPTTAAPETARYMPTIDASSGATSHSRALWTIGIAIAGIVGLGGLAIGIGLAATDRHPASTPTVDASTEYLPPSEPSPSGVTATTAGATTKATAPKPNPPTITNGTWTVGVDIPAGSYRATDAGTECFWEIRKSGTTDAEGIVENQLGVGPWTATLSAGQDFETDGCGTWTKMK